MIPPAVTQESKPPEPSPPFRMEVSGSFHYWMEAQPSLEQKPFNLGDGGGAGDADVEDLDVGEDGEERVGPAVNTDPYAIGKESPAAMLARQIAEAMAAGGEILGAVVEQRLARRPAKPARREPPAGAPPLVEQRDLKPRGAQALRAGQAGHPGANHRDRG